MKRNKNDRRKNEEFHIKIWVEQRFLDVDGNEVSDSITSKQFIKEEIQRTKQKKMNDSIKDNCFSSIEDNFRGLYLKKDQDLNSRKTDTNNFESKSDLTNGSNANNSQVRTSLEQNKRGVFSTTKTGIDIEKATFFHGNQIDNQI
jgi:hypothetical protein